MGRASFSFIEYFSICIFCGLAGFLIGYRICEYKKGITPVEATKPVYVITDSLYKANETKQDSLINRLNKEVFIGCGKYKEIPNAK